MIKFALAIVLGAALGAAAFWFYTSGGATKLRLSSTQLPAPAQAVKDAIDNFKVEDVKEELARTGTVVREKARQAGSAIADATADARITATIKGKFLADSELPSFQIAVSTTDGVVTLSGKVSTADAVTRAVNIAFGVDGVHKVFSTLQLPSPPAKTRP